MPTWIRSGLGSGFHSKLARQIRQRALVTHIKTLRNVRGDDPALISWYKVYLGCTRQTLQRDLAALHEDGTLTRKPVALTHSFRYTVAQ